MIKDYYSILGIKFPSSTAEIKNAYKKLAKLYHPDVNNIDTTSKMQEINEAYKILSNSKHKILYDKYYTNFEIFDRKEKHINSDEDLIKVREKLEKVILSIKKELKNTGIVAIDEFKGILISCIEAIIGIGILLFLLKIILF